ncbi:MAG: GDP-mannose 4,6-dehydratase [Candidatus Omnitrophota bacterium]|jgi:GDP-4-dehydro-6-deoxy-D-mannose reductase
MKSKRILITGISGFCGRILAGSLASAAGTVVLGLDAQRAGVTGKRVPYRVERADITDRAAVDAVVKRFRPDEIYHLAALAVPQQSWDAPDRTFTVNTGGTIHLLDAVRKFCPQARMLFASTAQVYGSSFRQTARVTEKTRVQPENPYGASKAAAELACMDFFARFQVRVVVSRAFNHFGASQSGPFVFSQWCRQVAQAEAGEGPAEIRVGNFGVEREFLHVDDVVSAYRLLLERGAAGGVYNVCYGRAYPLKTYLDYLVSKSSRRLRVIRDPKLVRGHEIRRMAGSPTLLKRLGWKPRKDVFLAIDELLSAWRERCACVQKKERLP